MRLGILLLFQSEKKLAMRGMDVQEITLQELYQNQQIFLDEFITSSVDLNSHIRLTQASKLIHIDIFQ